MRGVFGFFGAMSSTRASACAGSSAGMLPSRLLPSWKAATASSSVAARKCTRAPRHCVCVVWRKKCHGADIVEPSVLRPDARIIKSRRNRMGFLDLTVVVHHKVVAVAMRTAVPAAGDGGCVFATVQSVSGGLDAKNFDAVFVEEGMEQAHGIRAAADAGDQRVRRTTLGLLHLFAGLAADDRLEVAHHGRIGMRTRYRADAIERVVHISDPIAQRLV